MAKAEVNIPIVGDASKYKAALKDAGDATTGFAGQLGKIGKVLGGAFAVGAVVDAAGAAVKAAADDAKSQAILHDQLRKTTGATDDQIDSVEKFISKTQNASGVLDDNLRPALGTLVRATKDTGKAQDLLGLSMDISAATGKDLESVSLAVAKAYNGNVGGLQRLGISMKDANGESLSFADAQKQLSDQFGGATAAAADTAEGKYRIMQARFSDLEEEVGAKLLPVLTGLAEFMTTVLIPAVEAVVAWFEDNWPKIQDVIVGVFETVKPYIMGVVDFIQTLWDTFGQTLVDFTKRYLGAIRDTVEGVMEVISGIFQLFKDILTGKWGDLWGDVVKIVTGIKDVITGVIEGIWAQVELVAGVAWDGIKGVVTGAWDDIVDFIKGMPGKIASAAVGMFDGIVKAFKGAINTIIRGWNGLDFTLPSFDTHIPGIGTVGGFTIGVPDIPLLAGGGIVKARPGGMLARIGEGGQDEAVIPLDGKQGMGGVHIAEFHMHVQSVPTPNELVTILKKYEMRNGAGWRS